MGILESCSQRKSGVPLNKWIQLQPRKRINIYIYGLADGLTGQAETFSMTNRLPWLLVAGPLTAVRPPYHMQPGQPPDHLDLSAPVRSSRTKVM
jgi:hypothetical protein